MWYFYILAPHEALIYRNTTSKNAPVPGVEKNPIKNPIYKMQKSIAIYLKSVI